MKGSNEGERKEGGSEGRMFGIGERQGGRARANIQFSEVVVCLQSLHTE